MSLNLQIVSDLHWEFHADKGRGFVAAMDPTGVDVLIVAGDLTTAKYLEQSLTWLCERFEHVVYVHGNHEHYNASPAKV